MEAPSGEYNFTRLESVLYGPGRLELLGRELDRRGCKRTLVITGQSLGRSKLLDKVKAALGDRCAGVFTGARQHVPSRTLADAIDHARRANADSLISFGGGSPNDTAKLTAMAFLRLPMPRHIDAAIGAAITDPPRELIHIAIPTTLSAGEFTPFGGVTDEATRKKGGGGDARLQARAVILDPALTVETPAWLWASTAMKALDHAIEASYSSRHSPVTDTLAARSIELLTTHLLPSLQTSGADELAHRGYCQLAAWFSIFGAINTRLGLSHALGHQIGARWDVPHGVTSCITVPHVMRFMANVAPERFAPIARGFGVAFDERNPRASALECAERAQKFIAKFEVPARLRDVEVARGELAQIAESVLDEINRAHVLERPVSASEIGAILDAAY